MNEVEKFCERLNIQIQELEKSADKVKTRLQNIESYINARVNRAKKLMPIDKSTDWINKTSIVINIISDIQRAIEKVDEVDFTVIKGDVCIDDVELPFTLVDNRLEEFEIVT